jgi:hypothetical protein
VAVEHYCALNFRAQKGMKTMERLKYYRMLQILCSRLAEAYGSDFFPNVTIFVVNNIILGIYGIIKLYDDLTFDKLLNFPIMITVMLLGLMTFWPKMATVYEQTKDEGRNSLQMALASNTFKKAFMQVMKKDSRKRNAMPRDDENRIHVAETEDEHHVSLWKETECIARSCRVIGVPFGSLYLIKRSTVLSLFNFIACNTVSTLITYP